MVVAGMALPSIWCGANNYTVNLKRSCYFCHDGKLAAACDNDGLARHPFFIARHP
jgi:hypothetical protein